MNIYIKGFSSISKNGIISSHTENTEFNNHQSPLSIERKTVYSKLHTGFGKLNPPDKLAFSAAALILDNIAPLPSEQSGISLGTTVGSLYTDLRYNKTVIDGYPSPAYFQATLPSSAVAEVAIMFKLKGPDRSISMKSGASLGALLSAERALRLKKAENMLFLFINGLSMEETNPNFTQILNNVNPFAYALLLSTRQERDSIFKLTMNHSFGNSSSDSEDSEEDYFFKLITAVKNYNSFSESISLNETNLHINIEKEN